jgi:hypothetical protein
MKKDANIELHALELINADLIDLHELGETLWKVLRRKIHVGKSI